MMKKPIAFHHRRRFVNGIYARDLTVANHGVQPAGFFFRQNLQGCESLFLTLVDKTLSYPGSGIR
jgi:hypothetical protein